MVYVNLLSSSGGADGGGATIVPSKVSKDGKDCLYIQSQNSHVYADGYDQTGNEFYVPYADGVSTPPTVFVYNNDLTYLLYTNQKVEYNQTSEKNEIYGYFPTTLKDCTVSIPTTGWQTLELTSGKLFN